MRTERGFTLMEVLITMAIIAVLAAIAIPNYTAYITRSHRSEARQQLLEAAAFLQRCFTQNNDYRCAPTSPADMTAPFNQSPPAPAPAKYNIRVTAGGGNNSITYTLTAVPTGSMTGDPCGNLTLTHTGERGRSGSESMDMCWNR
jgi:type IV pilus assembly protein PilE